MPVRPLDGITVVTLEHAIAAPFCTRQLADLGARVIKIERPGVGDFARHYDERVHGLASHFVWTNRSKESVTLDVKHAEGARVLEQLVDRADIVVQNLAPGAAARLGLSHEAVSRNDPGKIVCDISGYGADGPYRDKKAYDLLVQSESGFLSITGTEAEPAKAGCSIADIAAGMYAYSTILAALIQRQQSGQGCHIEVPLLDAMTEWMGYALYYGFEGAPPPPRTGAAHATIYPYGPFATGDGGSVMLSVQNEREWQAFCERVLARPDLTADERFSRNSARVQSRHELKGVIEQVFSELTTGQVVERLDAARIANARVNTIADVWAHPQLAARDRWARIDSPAGPLPAMLPPGAPGAFSPSMGPVPALGEHTEAVLQEIGYDTAAIAALREAGAV